MALVAGGWPSASRAARNSSRRPRRRRPPEATRPPENNDQTLRPLAPEEIPPNLSFYAMDPLYKPGVPLGWATDADRRDARSRPGGVAARRRARLSELAPARVRSRATCAFNVYRATAGGAPAGSTPSPSGAPPTSSTPGAARSRAHVVGHAGRERARAGAVRTRHASGQRAARRRIAR